MKESNKAKADSGERSSSERGCVSPAEEPVSEAYLLSQALQREMGEMGSSWVWDIYGS